MTTFSNKQLSTSEQTGFIGNIDGNDIFATPFGDNGESMIIMHKGGAVTMGLEVTCWYPHAYALFLIKGFKPNPVINPDQVAKKDRIPLTSSTRREVEEAISRFNLRVSGPVISDKPQNHGDNSSALDDIIKNLPEEYRVGPMASLKSSVIWSAVSNCSFYLMTTAKALADADANTSNVTGLDRFNEAMNYLRGQPDEDMLMDEMGLTTNTGKWEEIRNCLMYANRLNLDMQEILDPQGKKKEANPGLKLGYGVTTGSTQRKAALRITIKAYTEYKKPKVSKGTYEDHVAEMGHNALALDKWTKLNKAKPTFEETYSEHIFDALMNACSGTDEAEFHDLEPATQIHFIENMKTKIPNYIDKAIDAVERNWKLSPEDKVIEGTKIQMEIKAWDKAFTNMLGSSRYACFTDKMRTITILDADDVVETRAMRAKNEVVDDIIATNRKTNVEEDDLVEDKRIEDMESDIL